MWHRLKNSLKDSKGDWNWTKIGALAGLAAAVFAGLAYLFPRADAQPTSAPTEPTPTTETTEPTQPGPIAISGDPCSTEMPHGKLEDVETDAGVRTLRVIRVGGLRDEAWKNQDQLVIGTPGDDDNIQGNTGDDILCGLGGDDKLMGNQGDDHLFGGEGADELRGQDGYDWLHGDSDDTLYGGHGPGGESGTRDAFNYCEPVNIDPAAACVEPPG
jgi:hypothetical protein